MNEHTNLTLLVDTHVHFHECFDRATFFGSAWRNLHAGARTAGVTGETLPCLLFTESEGARHFAAFAEEAKDPAAPRTWTFESTAEEFCLVAVGPQDERILLVAGRQIVTTENLEVLALGRDLEIPDGRPLRDVVTDVTATGALATVPWGFGKWWGKRGQLIEAIIEDPPARPLFLGDNSGRLRLSRRPAFFGQAEARGIFVLPGSDPLPFPGQARCVGRYGCHLTVPMDEGSPGASVLNAFTGLDTPPPTFGRLETPPAFVRSQIAMQLRKRFART